MRPEPKVLIPVFLLTSCGEKSVVDTADSSPTPTPPDTPLDFQLPIAEPERISDWVLGMDHDPVVYEGVWRVTCTNYRGDSFPWCYDEHDGTDFPLEGGFEAMDGESATVIAAAAGTVIETEDGHYDHCHGDITTMEVSCDGHEIIGNHVIIQHETGHQTLYWHLKSGSVMVQPGQKVEAGEVLGKIGSSGYSTLPHLHFELRDAEGTPIDPYAGPYSQPESWWCDQGEEPEDLPGTCTE